MFKSVTNSAELATAIASEDALLVYFSHEQCNVCKVLKPKIESLITSQYPNIQMCYADTVLHPEIAAQHAVFAVPTILVWFQGRETFRFSRNIGLNELENALNRPYNLLF
jgi:thioredoxin-like negative regulator of GroEL